MVWSQTPYHFVNQDDDNGSGDLDSPSLSKLPTCLHNKLTTWNEEKKKNRNMEELICERGGGAMVIKVFPFTLGGSHYLHNANVGAFQNNMRSLYYWSIKQGKKEW
jgi:hypothetical protein